MSDLTAPPPIERPRSRPSGMATRDSGRSPAFALLIGLLITLAAVTAYSWYISAQISGLRRLQTELTDRNRGESLQLLRIQNDLNQLALAMRDMLDTTERYPLVAWSAPFERIRLDLDDALARRAAVAVARQTPDQVEYLARSVTQFWEAAERIFTLARSGDESAARAQIRLSLQARQAALSTTVARLLVQNNATEERTAEQVQAIYASVQRKIYQFFAVVLIAIVATGLYQIGANRRLFAELASLLAQRRELTQTLIAARESAVGDIARELHDQLGQLLTAMGSMLRRTGKQVPEATPLHDDLREIAGVAQTALDHVRGLSQTLHPSTLEEFGLESAVDAYLSTVERQLGIRARYERSGSAAGLHPAIGIQVYRILQEAMANVARHSGATEAWVRLRSGADALELEVEDHGRGIAPAGAARGLGIVAMRERAALVGGSVEILPRRDTGTLVRLRVPLAGRLSPA